MKTIKWNKPTFDKDENIRNDRNGYRVPCSGDSGSGQVFLTSINEEHEKKQMDTYVLAAVFADDVADVFIDDNNEDYLVPCGTYAWDHSKMKYQMSAARAISTSWPEIFNWIKNQAQIK